MTIQRISTFMAVTLIWLGALAAPQAKWKTTSHNFGAFSEDLGKVECTFTAINVGNEPLQVLSARANCGCTVPDYDRNPIAPGDTLHIRVSYNPAGRPGRFDKKIYVYTNTDHDKYTLTITGTVMASQNTIKSRYPIAAGPAHFNTTFLALGEHIKGHTGSTFLRGYNATDSVILPEVENLPPYMRAEVRPTMVRPGEQFVISLNSYTGQCPTYGIVTDTIQVIPDSSSDYRLPVTTVITVKESFSNLSPEDREKAPKSELSTEVLDFGSFSRKSERLSRKFTVTNKGIVPLMIRRAYSPAAGITVISPRISRGIEKDKEVEFEVIVDPSMISEGDILNARVTFISNDPENPTRIIRVIGEPQD